VNALRLSLTISVVATLLSAVARYTVAQDLGRNALEESRSLHDTAWAIHHVPDRFATSGEASKHIFLNMPQFYLHSFVNRSGPVRELALALRDDVASFVTQTELGVLPLWEYVSNPASAVDGFLVVHEGAIAFEAYPSMQPSDKHIYFSVSKVFVSTAVALLEQRGLLDVNESIETYFPELEETGWDGVRVIDILDMSSGMDCPNAIGDMTSCFEQSWTAYGRPIGYDEDSSLENPLDYFAQIPAHRPAGQAFEYADINPLLLTLLVEELSGKTFDAFLKEEIWQQMGAESDAMLLTAANGRSATPLGMSSTLRDMARFGLLFTPSGRQKADPIISDETLTKIQFGGRPEIFEQGSFANLFGGEQAIRNTYQWDHVTTEGDFFKDGVAGQGLYISPSRDLVIAFFGSWAEYQLWDEMPAVARQLAKSGLFSQ